MTATSDKITKFEISTFEDYLTYVKEAEVRLLITNKDDIVIYRGQPVDKHLYPKLGREEYKVSNRLDFEKKLITEFNRLSCPHLEGRDYSTWDVIAIAQHHNLPTRLLDWTSNPLIALWFAIFSEPKDAPKRVVWCYSFKHTEIVNPNLDHPYTQQKTLVYQPKHITKRIVSQNGWFTSHFYGEKTNIYTALDLKIGTYRKLVKIELNIDERNDKKSFLRDLDTYGINSYSIFPDLEGLCQYLDWKVYKK